MADEIKVTIAADLVKDNLKRSFKPGQVAITQDAKLAIAGVWTVGSAGEENLGIGDITTMGWLFMRNLDTTNYVRWGMSDSGTMKVVGRMEPGEPVAFRVEPGTTIRAQANGAPVPVEYELWND